MRPKKILVTGPESSGKSTLARQLATCFRGAYVPEFARTYLERYGPAYERTDLITMLRGQLAAEQRTMRKEAPVVFCDTGPEVYHVWSRWTYGEVDPFIEASLRTTRYDLALLCFPEYEWAPDPLREHPSLEDRLRLFEEYRSLLRTLPYPTYPLKPSERSAGEHQFEQAVRVVNPQTCDPHPEQSTH